ncbi:MAG: methyltransferase [Paludibacter sp.]|nr:methyltransferase [Paludibacter sp.]
MNSKERLQQSLRHKQPDKMPVDFGSTSVSGIHCKIVSELRDFYGLEKRPIKVIEPYQMLGEIDFELQEIIGVDTVGLFGPTNMLGLSDAQMHEQLTPWGQPVIISKEIDLSPDNKGDIYMFPKGDRKNSPGAIMPSGCYFVNAIERQSDIDEEHMNPEDNLEEFGVITDNELNYFAEKIKPLVQRDKVVVASFGGTALGDVAFIPGMSLENPKGIRSVAEWYMSTVMRQDYIQAVFEKQIDIAIENYKKLWATLGSKVDVVFTCGTDFGTQNSQFCSPETFNELWKPHYRRMNDWIHSNTTWKVFKHSCGAILPILPGIIESGFDIINPVQINAKDMDSRRLKFEFGKDLTFWGGGIDTQQILPNSNPDEIRTHVLKQCEIFNKDGGFVFNAVHNIQANAPVKNFVAMIDAIKEFNK